MIVIGWPAVPEREARVSSACEMVGRGKYILYDMPTERNRRDLPWSAPHGDLKQTDQRNHPEHCRIQPAGYIVSCVGNAVVDIRPLVKYRAGTATLRSLVGGAVKMHWYSRLVRR
jgi:hypothetical protein